MTKEDTCVFEVTDTRKYHWENAFFRCANFIEFILPLVAGVLACTALFSPLGVFLLLLVPVFATCVSIPIIISKLPVTMRVRLCLFLLYNFCTFALAFYFEDASFSRVYRFWAWYLVSPTILYASLLIRGKREFFDSQDKI
ncbi:MAG: hypothetical protein PHQ75_10970 [Thermoguttaceae bacterium]|nr:hypothetical protein [Thermoguttaceae bacterium]